MDDIIFLDIDDVTYIHAIQIEHFGGASELLSREKLESALAMPQQSIGGKYLHDGLASMAAAYLFHICQNHPFADGNKRTASHAAIAFLRVNGASLLWNTDTAEAIVLAVATGNLSKRQLELQLQEFLNF